MNRRRLGALNHFKRARERGRSETADWPERRGRKRSSVSDSGRAIQSPIAGREGRSPGHEQEKADLKHPQVGVE